MATENIANSLVSVEFLPDGQTPVISSRDMALHFQKKHKHVLDEIRRIQSMVPKDFYEPNFRPIEHDVLLPHSGGIRKDPAYLLTRDAFSLLAMGFTGKAAIQWKLRYIAAFNALEAAALERVRCTALQQGVSLQSRLTPKRLALMRKAVTFRKRGFSHREIGKMLDCSHSSAQALLKDATLLWQEVPA